MKTTLRQSTSYKVYGGQVKTKFTGQMKTRLRGSPNEPEPVGDFRILEDGDLRALENGDLRILE